MNDPGSMNIDAAISLVQAGVQDRNAWDLLIALLHKASDGITAPQVLALKDLADQLASSSRDEADALAERLSGVNTAACCWLRAMLFEGLRKRAEAAAILNAMPELP